MYVALVCTCLSVWLSTVQGLSCPATMSATEGPYYKKGSPFRGDNSICEWKRVGGIQLLVRGRVYGPGCQTIVNAVLDVWSADPSGEYSPHNYGKDYTCRGKVLTDASGNYQFLTTVPGRYKQGNMYRPMHIHFKVSRNNGPTENQGFNGGRGKRRSGFGHGGGRGHSGGRGLDIIRGHGSGAKWVHGRPSPGGGRPGPSSEWNQGRPGKGGWWNRGRTLTTQLYFRNDSSIASDPCGFQTCRAGDPTITLPLQSQNGQSYLVTFNIILNQ